MLDTNSDTSLQDLQTFLEKLFQFENADLDFGIYKILNYKKTEIQHFVNTLLTEEVRKQLNVLAGVETKTFAEQLQEMEAEDVIKGYNKAVAENDDTTKNVLLSVSRAKIEQYETLKQQIAKHDQTAQAEPHIYKHLALFFSRYYDKGDFISKRRYGKTEKYIVPYNGEETYFHWANADQYYIKTSEFFSTYAFRIPSATGHTTVNFKLKQAEQDQGNVKSKETKYFVLADSPLEARNDVINIYFENRSLKEAEKTQKGNSQEKLNNYALPLIKQALGNNPAVVALFTENNEKTKISTELNRYTARNTYDFFIHKNLKGFLSRELDFYIKSELLKLDDLTVFDSEAHFESIRLQFNVVKTFKNIATIIIDFISQIEDFQKKLWEKKKFVIESHYVISLDKLAVNTTPEFAEEIIKEVITNTAQILEWKELFGEEIITDWDNIQIEELKGDEGGYRKLVIDTKHFTTEFKWKLITEISKTQNIDEIIDGVIFHSDNYHALQILQEKYFEKSQSIYIDPPYNTDASAILYKNNYKDSSWLSLMEARLNLAYNLLKEDGIICVAIDDEEVSGTRFLLDKIFIKQAGIATIRSNPAGRKTKGKFAPAHEYALFYGKSDKAIPDALDITESRLKRYPKEDAKGNYAWANFIRSGNNDKREDRPKLYYPIFVNDNDEIRIPDMEWDDETQEYIINEESKPNEVAIYPVLKSGRTIIEKNWQRGNLRVPKELEEYRIRRNDEGEISIDFKTRMDEDSLPITWWDSKKYASANHGAAELKKLFGKKTFDFPKALILVLDSLKATGAKEEDAIVIDYFPGSGTTFHAVQCLNKEDNGKRKCILAEQGDYVYSLIIPRAKKVGYSFDWKTGKPQSQNGLGVFFKYQRLEQYEESLENIAFTSTSTSQIQLQFKDYIPKYFLNFETAESKTFLNVDEMKDPFSYELKVFNNYDYVSHKVDLIETFNYLIGLFASGYFISEHQNRKYVLVTGTDNQNRNITIVWRNATDLNFEQDRDYITLQLQGKPYNILYVNNQCAVEGAIMIEEVFKTKMN